MPIRKSSISGGSTPSGTTADRPANPSIGDTFFNGSLGVQEIYTDSGWLPATGANDFNVVLTGSETLTQLSKEYFPGAYTINSSLSDTTMDVYLFSSSNSLVGYSNTPAINATNNFDKVVVYGGTAGDLLSFSYKTTFTSSTTNSDNFAPPYITSLSTVTLDAPDTSTTIFGGNFSETTEVYFVGSNNFSELAKSVVLSSSTEMIVTRPDNLSSSDLPISIKVVNPLVTEPTKTNKNKSANLQLGSASGGTVSEANGYKYHVFSANSTLNIQGSLAVEATIIAGGGAGGPHVGGGGGGGGLLVVSDISLGTGSYPVVVGAGAAATSGAVNGANGNSSSFSSNTAIGGGGGGTYGPDRSPQTGSSGGSGGGGGGTDASLTASGGAGTPGQGNDGGSVGARSGGNTSGAPGGGAGASGATRSDASSPDKLNGGDGLPVTVGANTYYFAAGGGPGTYSSVPGGNGGRGGAGGGGSHSSSGGTAGADGINSGGNGASASNGAGGAGGENTGSGGGGAGGGGSPGGLSGAGGSGIVIIRYAI